MPSGSTLTTLTNSAQVTAITPDPVGGNNNASASTNVGRQAALRVDKVVAPAPLVPGRDAEYTITVTNDGPSDAVATLVGDALDDALSPSGPAVPSQGTCSYIGAQLGCDLGVRRRRRLGHGARAGEGRRGDDEDVDRQQRHGDHVDAWHAAGDRHRRPRPSRAARRPDADQDRAGAGDRRDGRSPGASSVSNAGPSVATAVVITDQLPPGLGTMSIVASQGACVQDLIAATITCQVGNLAPGSSVSIQVSGTVPAGSTATALLNSATVTSPVAEPVAGPDGRSASTTTEVDTRADVSIVKRALVDPAVPGEGLHWTITVSNAGPSVARFLQVTEDPPAGLDNLVITPPAPFPDDTSVRRAATPVISPRSMSVRRAR